MSIRFKCECGKVVSAPDTAAGRMGKCPGCGKEIRIPVAGTGQEPGGQVPGGLNLGAGGISENAGKTKPGLKKGLALGVLAAILILIVVAFFVFRRRALLTVWDMIPQNVSAVGSLDVPSIIKLPAIREAIDDVQSQEDYDIVRTLKLTPENISRIHFAGDMSDIKPGLSNSLPEGLVFFETIEPLDEKAVVAELEKNGMISRREKLEGKDTYTLDTKKGGPTVMLMFPQEGIAVIGSSSMVKSAAGLAACKKGARSISSNAELMELCSQVDRARMFWLVTLVPKQSQGAAPPPGMGMMSIQPDSFTGFILQGDYNEAKGLALELALQCKSEQVANESVPQFKMLLALFGGGIPQGALDLTSEGKDIKINLVLSKEQILQLAAAAKSAGPTGLPGMPGPPSVKLPKEFTDTEGSDKSLEDVEMNEDFQKMLEELKKQQEESQEQ